MLADPQVDAVMESWLPHGVRDEHPQVVAAVLPTVRWVVAAAAPATPTAARRMLWAVAPMGCWAHRVLGAFAAHDINPRNVEVWTCVVNRKRPRGWRNASRAALRRVGRAVNAQAWPDQPEQVGRPPARMPYDAGQEAAFRAVAGLRGTDHPEAQSWVVAAAFGTGQRGPEIVAGETGDVCEVGEGRLAVRVRGRDARLVPVRECCTELVRRAVRLVAERADGSTHFLGSCNRNAAGRVASSLPITDGMSLRRARATWLTAHLVAGTPLPVLREIAGPLSVATLDDLLAVTGHTVSAERAVTEALRA